MEKEKTSKHPNRWVGYICPKCYDENCICILMNTGCVGKRDYCYEMKCANCCHEFNIQSRYYGKQKADENVIKI